MKETLFTPANQEAISREAILDKTHYGLNIYLHVLRQYYPGETVLYLSGRECKLTRNPFNDNQPTLKVQIVNNCAVHHDLENSICKGDAFDFAALHYKLEGNELHKMLNEELHLHIGKQKGFYNDPVIVIPEPHPVKISSPGFSHFKAPISNTMPHGKINSLEVYHLLKGRTFTKATAVLRSIVDEQKAKKYKAANFDCVTFSGLFSKRENKSLLRHSGLIVFDFDDLESTLELKGKLLHDEHFETELLFTSPSGDGLKWVIPIDLTKANHLDHFNAIANYIEHTYKLEVDPSGKDVCRACYLPHDEEAFINPKYFQHDKSHG